MATDAASSTQASPALHTTSTPETRRVRIGAISVPSAAKNAADYEFAVANSTWGSRRPQNPDNPSTPRPHDILLIATGYQRPDPATATGFNRNPRISQEDYDTGSIASAVIVEVTGLPYESDAPHWPGEDGVAGVRYPFRFPVSPLGEIHSTDIISLPPSLRECLHDSAIDGSRAHVTEVSVPDADSVAKLAGADDWHALVEVRNGPPFDFIGPLSVSSASSASRSTATPKKSAGAGRQMDPKKRTAVEHYAMALARTHYEALEWSVETKGAPYDLLCTRDEEYLRVEVKGTTGGAGDVELTVNEVSSARNHPSELFVVSNIRAPKKTGTDGEVFFPTSGGEARVLRNWQPDDADLLASKYRYRIPDDRAEVLPTPDSGTDGQSAR